MALGPLGALRRTRTQMTRTSTTTRAAQGSTHGSGFGRDPSCGAAAGHASANVMDRWRMVRHFLYLENRSTLRAERDGCATEDTLRRWLSVLSARYGGHALR